jgi:hypothetical protein
MSLNKLQYLPDVVVTAVSYIMKESQDERELLGKTLGVKLTNIEEGGGILGKIAKFAKSLLPNFETKSDSDKEQKNKNTPSNSIVKNPHKASEQPTNLEQKTSENKQQVASLLDEACQQLGANPSNIKPIMMAICHLESGFNPKSQNNKSGAAGLFQFTGKTKTNYRNWAIKNGFPELENTKDDPGTLAGIFDPKINTFAGVKLLMENAKSLNIDLGKPMDANELKTAAIKLYAAHNSGSGNVAAIMQALNGNYDLIKQKAVQYPWLKGREKYIRKVGDLAVGYMNNPNS